MHGTLRRKIDDAREIERKLVRGDARICGEPNFAKCWKALFPSPAYKPAAELAARVGCSVRTAEYELAGDHHPSAQSIAALIAEIVPPWKRG